APRGLELGFSTPRPWLSDGRRILVRRAPTSFGLVSFSIERHGRLVHVTVDPPASPRPRWLRLRLRLPAGDRVAAVRLAGRPLRRAAMTATIDLSGLAGRLD